MKKLLWLLIVQVLFLWSAMPAMSNTETNITFNMIMAKENRTPQKAQELSRFLFQALEPRSKNFFVKTIDREKWTYIQALTDKEGSILMVWNKNQTDLLSYVESPDKKYLACLFLAMPFVSSVDYPTLLLVMDLRTGEVRQSPFARKECIVINRWDGNIFKAFVFNWKNPKTGGNKPAGYRIYSWSQLRPLTWDSETGPILLLSKVWQSLLTKSYQVPNVKFLTRGELVRFNKIPAKPIITALIYNDNQYGEGISLNVKRGREIMPFYAGYENLRNRVKVNIGCGESDDS